MFKRKRFFLLPLLSLMVILPLALPRFVVSVEAKPTTLFLDGQIQAWNASSIPNPTIIVHQGERLRIELNSSDGVTHQFFVDVDRDGSANCTIDKCSDPFGGSFTGSTTYQFSVKFPVGTYSYFCNFHPATMHGLFIVEA